ncbi:hypothetical protein UT300012_23510 [Paraclostridium bifermentans]
MNSLMNGKTVGTRLEGLRRFMKMTQVEFASEVGVSGSTIGSYERDYRDIDDQVRKALVDKYGVRLDWLMKGEGQIFDDRSHVNDLVGLYIRLGEDKREAVYNSLVNELEK